MRFVPMAFLLLACVFSCLASQAGAQTEEPPMRYQIEVNGTAIPVELDKPLEIEASGRVQIKLVLQPTRVFSHGGVRFEFPTGFKFQPAVDEESGHWSLEGNECLMMVTEFFEEYMEHHEMAESIASNFSGAEADYLDCKLEGGNFSLRGTRLLIPVAGNRTLVYEVYAVPTEGGSRFLMAQEIRPEDSADKPSPEFASSLELAVRTFSITRPEAWEYDNDGKVK